MSATCATLLAVLAQASPGATVQLVGNCGPIELARAYARPVTIDASRATVRGLKISGRNIIWRGGTIAARDGRYGKGVNGYAVHITGTGVSLTGATVTQARIGVLVNKAAQVRLERNRLTGLRVDGVVLVASRGIVLSHNRIEDQRPDPPVCHTLAGAKLLNVRPKACDGRWEDGDHPDAIQMRDGLSDVLIESNVITGNTQGIAQMDAPSDAPLSRIRIVANEIATDNYHHITLGDCRECRIERNIVRRAKGSQRKAIIRAGMATRCGNRVQDEAGADRPCR